MTIEELLKNKLISTGAVATTLWPDKPAQNARALLRNKVYNLQGKRLTDDEKEEIKKILKNICIVL